MVCRPAAAGVGLGLLIAAVAGAAGQEASPFDGATLSDWEGDPRFWRIEAGAIVGESTTENPCTETTYLIWTGGEVADFDLRLEFRLHGGNSGVQFRSQRRAGFQVAGYQADLDLANEWTGGLYEQDGRGVVARRGQRLVCTADGRIDASTLVQPDRPAVLPRPGEWNEYRIVARGPRIELELNGERTCELVDHDPQHGRRAGVLALQLHQGPPMRVEFRNLRLSTLPPDPAEVDELEAMDESISREQVPLWIWSQPVAEPRERAWFFREITLDVLPERAWIEGSCDNAMEVLLNGRTVLRGDDWTRPVSADVTADLLAGRNLIAVLARNEGGPAALELALDLEYPGGEELRFVTDDEWRCWVTEPPGWDQLDFDPDGLPSAHVIGPLGAGVWGSLSEVGNPADSSALAAEEVEVAPGYAVELVYSVPRALYGSWVALCFDARGRAIVSDEGGGLHRLTLPPSSEGEVEVETLDETLGGAQGLCSVGRDLYAVAHRRGEHASGLYRLRDADGDERYEAIELLLALEGSGEHGPHAVLLEPGGGRLVLVGGNHTKLPEVASSRVPLSWDEDQLLPRRDDPGGHAVGVMAPGGWIVRTDLDGRDAELVACGLRNAYDAAFGPDGELFGYDSDMEWDIGIAWYRPPRVLHLASGADFGWRHGSGKWPAYWPDSWPSAADTDLSSPVGVLYGRELEAFAERERRALFLGDWAYGRILVLDLEPRGASWTGSVRPFVSGKPLPVTDLASGPDGALYFTTGGRGTQSGLYRVRPDGGNVAETSPPSWPQWSARAQRRALEAFHGRAHPLAVDAAWPWLDSADPFLRGAARVAIEWQPLEAWRERALAETQPRAAVQAAIALSHSGQAALAGQVSDLLARLPLEELDTDTAVAVLRAAALVEMRLGGAPPLQRQALVERLELMFPQGDDRLDRELCRLLVRLGSPRVVAPALQLLEHAATQEEATHYAFALVHAHHGWTDELCLRYVAWLESARERSTGGASFAGYLDGLGEDAYALFGLEAEALAEAAAATAGAVPRRFVRAWSLVDLEGELGALSRGRSFEVGRAAYLSAQCASCHPIGGQGGRDGPDLSGAGSRFSPRDLLEAVLEPSRVVSDQYLDTEILTLDDELLVGRRIGEDAQAVQLRSLPPGEEIFSVPLSEISSRRPHPLSRMPRGLVDTLERDELLDLLAYVLAGGDPHDPRFD